MRVMPNFVESFLFVFGLIDLSLRLEGLEIIQSPFQKTDLYFSNQNCTRNPKMGSKQSIPDPTQYYFFQKTIFRQNKSSKKLDVLLIFEFLWQYIWIN